MPPIPFRMRSGSSMKTWTRKPPRKFFAATFYAKLNYAVNSAHLGPEALNVLTEDELIAWPSEMPFATMAELDEEVEESN